MLCDTIHQYSDKVINSWKDTYGEDTRAEDIPALQQVLDRSQRFFLSPEFTKMSTFQNGGEYFSKIKPLVKLPYDPLWIEYRASDHEKGYLISNTPNQGLTVLLFRCSMKNEDRTPAKIFIDTLGWTFYPNEYAWNASTDEAKLPFSIQVAKKEVNNGEKQKTVVLVESYKIMDILARINSRNITYTTEIDVSRINKKRSKNGKPNLLSYRIVELSKEVKRAFHLAGGPSADSQKLHWVRGHFKIRKTGIFWWNPHLAGVVEEGFIEKDYVV